MNKRLEEIRNRETGHCDWSDIDYLLSLIDTQEKEILSQGNIEYLNQLIDRYRAALEKIVNLRYWAEYQGDGGKRYYNFQDIARQALGEEQEWLEKINRKSCQHYGPTITANTGDAVHCQACKGEIKQPSFWENILSKVYTHGRREKTPGERSWQKLPEDELTIATAEQEIKRELKPLLERLRAKDDIETGKSINRRLDEVEKELGLL